MKAKQRCGKNRRIIAAVIPDDCHTYLKDQSRALGITMSALVNRILSEHAAGRIEYRIVRTTLDKVAESPESYDPQTTPLAPACCPLARAEMSNKGNGDGT